MPHFEFSAARRAETPCGFAFDIDGLYALSNHRLKALGLGMVSPLVVLEDGTPLATFSTRLDYEERCGGGSTVGRNAVFFAPSVPLEEAAARTYTLALSAALPQQTPTGALWWAYPGTNLSARFSDDGGWAGHSLTVQVRARTPQNRVTAAPVLKVGEQQVPLEQGEDGTLTASLSFVPPDGAWKTTLALPDTAPYLVVESWELVSSTGERRSLLSVPQLTQVALSAPPDITAGINLLEEGAALIEGKPPALALSTEAMTAVSPSVARLEEASLAALAPRSLRDRLGIRFSPIEVLEDGKPLPEPHASCTKVKEQARGRYCHSEAVVLISASDGSDPLQNGRRYQLRFSESRRFDGGLWLYPDDRLHTRALSVPEGTERVELRIEGAPVSEAAALRVRLLAADAVLLEQRLDAARLAEGPLVLALERPPASLQLEAAAEGGHLVLTTASLRAP